MKKVLLVVVLAITLFAFGCSQGSSVPSGNNCAENIAYLQAAADEYYEIFGEYPITLDQLREERDGKGPLVEVTLTCPTTNFPYIIENGLVKDGPGPN